MYAFVGFSRQYVLNSVSTSQRTHTHLQYKDQLFRKTVCLFSKSHKSTIWRKIKFLMLQYFLHITYLKDLNKYFWFLNLKLSNVFVQLSIYKQNATELHAADVWCCIWIRHFFYETRRLIYVFKEQPLVNIPFFVMAWQPLGGLDRLIFRGFTITHFLDTHTLGRTPLDEWSARRRDLYLTTHNTHNRHTSMPPVGFEPAIPVSERPKTHALYRTATGIGSCVISTGKAILIQA
jgi:hypothetical protein